MTHYMCFEESFTFSCLLTLVGWLLYHLSFCPIPNSVDGITCDWSLRFPSENLSKQLLDLFQNPAIISKCIFKMLLSILNYDTFGLSNLNFH